MILKGLFIASVLPGITTGCGPDGVWLAVPFLLGCVQYLLETDAKSFLLPLCNVSAPCFSARSRHILL